MNLYISDLHFGHKNVILFEHRPFSDVDTMDHGPMWEYPKVCVNLQTDVR